MIKIIDNVLPKTSLYFLHTFLTSEYIWNLSMLSTEGHHKIAGRVLLDVNLNINSKTSSQALAYFVYLSIRDKVKNLPLNPTRIHIGAKAPLQDDKLHTDSKSDEDLTVLFFLNPTWKKEWGGETIVGDKKIEYKPNRALIYKSNIIHGGTAPKSPVFRTYINYVCKSIK